MPTDSELLRDYCHDRNADAFAQLVRRHGAMVYGVALRTCRNVADAEDACQEAFIELARQARRVGDNIPAWLHTVARRLAMRAMERRRRVQAVDLSDAVDPSQRSDLLADVDIALEQLPTAERSVLVLHYLEGRSQEEVAAALGISQPTVHRRHKRGLAAVRKQLGTGAAVALLATPGLLPGAAPVMPATCAAGLGKVTIAGVAPGAVAGGGVGLGAMAVTAMAATAVAVVAAAAAGIVAVQEPEPPVPALAPAAAVAPPPAEPPAIDPVQAAAAAAADGIDLDALQARALGVTPSRAVRVRRIDPGHGKLQRSLMHLTGAWLWQIDDEPVRGAAWAQARIAEARQLKFRRRDGHLFIYEIDWSDAADAFELAERWHPELDYLRQRELRSGDWDRLACLAALDRRERPERALAALDRAIAAGLDGASPWSVELRARVLQRLDRHRDVLALVDAHPDLSARPQLVMLVHDSAMAVGHYARAHLLRAEHPQLLPPAVAHDDYRGDWDDLLARIDELPARTFGAPDSDLQAEHSNLRDYLTHRVGYAFSVRDPALEVSLGSLANPDVDLEATFAPGGAPWNRPAGTLRVIVLPDGTEEWSDQGSHRRVDRLADDALAGERNGLLVVELRNDGSWSIAHPDPVLSTAGRSEGLLPDPTASCPIRVAILDDELVVAVDGTTVLRGPAPSGDGYDVAVSIDHMVCNLRHFEVRDIGLQPLEEWALHDAVVADDGERVQALLDAGADPHLQLPGNFNLLHIAAAGGRAAALKVLLADGRLDAQALTDRKETGLHLATRFLNPTCVQLLTQAGCSWDQRNHWKWNAVDYPLYYGHWDLVEQGLAAHGPFGPDVTFYSWHVWATDGSRFQKLMGPEHPWRERPDALIWQWHLHRSLEGFTTEQIRAARAHDGGTLLHECASLGDVEGVRVALEHGVPIDATMPWSQETALQHAASRSLHPGIVALLLEHGADPRVETRWGGNALQSARRFDFAAGVALIEEWMAENPASPPAGGDTDGDAGATGDSGVEF